VTLLRARFDVVVALLLPGWLLLRAAGWPRSQPERLLLAGPASIAVIAVATAVLGRLGGHAFTQWELVALDAALAVLAWWRRGALRGEERLAWRWYVVGALPGLLLAGVAIASVGGLTYPPSEDSLVHATAVRWFLDGHAAPPYLVDHLRAMADPEVRYGWHAFAAALTRGTGLDAGLAVTAGGWPVVFMLPGSLMLLARRAGMGWRAALLTGFAAVGVGIVPFKFLALGQAPLLAGGYVLAPCAAVAWCDTLRLRTPGAAAVAVVLAGSVVFTHPSDLPTLTLLTAMLLPVALRGFRCPGLRDLAVVGTAAIAVLALIRIWTQYGSRPLAGTPFGDTVSGAVTSEQFVTPRHLTGFWDQAMASMTSLPHDWVLPILAVAALLLAWRELPARLFAAFGVVLLAIQVDAWGWQWPQSVLVRVFPWSSPERLMALDWFVFPPLAALAVLRVVDALRLPEDARRDPALTRALLAAAAVAAAVLPALTFSPGMLQHAHDAQTALTPADREAFDTVVAAVPAGHMVLTDGIADGGSWLSVLTDVDTLLHKDWNHNAAAPRIREVLRDLCAPGEAGRLRGLGVDWVYLGPDQANTNGDADRSCAATGTADLRPIPLPGSGAGGPWLLRVAPAVTG